MTRLQQTEWFPALKAAFPHTIPIFAGFWFLGLTYGIYMNVSGFSLRAGRKSAHSKEWKTWQKILVIATPSHLPEI